MDTYIDSYTALLSALEWQVELGISDTISEVPIDRFDETANALAASQVVLPMPNLAKSTQSSNAENMPKPVDTLRVDTAKIASECTTLQELEQAINALTGLSLKSAARNTVFADGNPAADLMVIGETPDIESDRSGTPFMGKTGVLLDNMLAAIGRSRSSDQPETSAYLTNMIFWRPAQGLAPSEEDIKFLMPFTCRHIELVKPKAILLLGGMSARYVMGLDGSLSKLRGKWGNCAKTGIKAIPTLHPDYLLKTPAAKRMAWKDLLALQAVLKGE